jgi:plasmid stabilization system protein ParE
MKNSDADQDDIQAIIDSGQAAEEVKDKDEYEQELAQELKDK